MSDVVGLSLREERVHCVVLRRRLSGTRVLDAFSLSADDELGPALRAKLRELGVRAPRVSVGIPRRLAVVKAIQLPAVPGADLRRMVGFELERHLPFPPSEALFDFDVLEGSPARPVRVLLVAVERRVFERIRQLLREAGLLPRVVDVSVHALALAAAQQDRTALQAGRVIVRFEETEAELAIVRGSHVLLSRAFPLPAEPGERGRVLVEELVRTLRGLGGEDREAIAEVILTGETPPTIDWHDVPVRVGVSEAPGLGSVDPAYLPAVAMALRRPARRGLRTNLVPDDLRPRPFPWPIAVTASLAAVALLLAAAIPALTAIRDEQTLAELDRAVARLAPDVRQVEQLVGAVERARREVEILRSFEGQGVPALPLLRELTEVLPGDVWLTNLSADRNGIELAGFAGSASQLIPLLEGSPRLDRVEFTSPVTKGRDREQFRLKAGWERR